MIPIHHRPSADVCPCPSTEYFAASRPVRLRTAKQGGLFLNRATSVPEAIAP